MSKAKSCTKCEKPLSNESESLCSECLEINLSDISLKEQPRIQSLLRGRRGLITLASAGGLIVALIMTAIFVNMTSEKAPSKGDIYWLSSDFFSEFPAQDTPPEDSRDFTKDFAGLPTCASTEELSRVLRTGTSWGTAGISQLPGFVLDLESNNYSIFQQVIEFADEATAEKTLELAGQVFQYANCSEDVYASQWQQQIASQRSGKYRDAAINITNFRNQETQTLTSEESFMFQKRSNVIMISGFYVQNYGQSWTKTWVAKEDLLYELGKIRSKFRNIQ